MLKLADFKWLIPMGLVLFFDQLTKSLIKTRIDLGSSVKLLPFLSLTHHINTGAGFGIFQNFNSVLIVVAILALVIISWYLPTLSDKEKLWAGLLMGGIAGNLVDRFLIGGVTDFILVYANIFGAVRYFPSFNIADSTITISIIVFALLGRKDGLAVKSDSHHPKTR